MLSIGKLPIQLTTPLLSPLHKPCKLFASRGFVSHSWAFLLVAATLQDAAEMLISANYH